MVEEDVVDRCRRRFLVALTSLMGGVGALFASVPFVSSWLPSGRAKAAGAPVEVDISHIQPGERLVVAWRGKPVWIIRRTPAELETLRTETVSLRDPDSLVDQQPAYAKNIYRSIKPEYLVLVGVCTHLGCAPTFVPKPRELGPSWPGGFYCPCHGSKFDLSGRVFAGVPAPINLEVPPYRFLSDTVIVVGENEEAGMA